MAARTKYLLTSCNAEEAKQAEQNYEQAKTQTDNDYEEMSAAAKIKVSSPHPSPLPIRCGDEGRGGNRVEAALERTSPAASSRPFRQRAGQAGDVSKLTTAINQAKDNGDIEWLREIAEDPHGFILRKGWANLDFSDTAELEQLRRLHETLKKEIADVTESLKQLRESPDYELCQLAEQRPGILDELAAERAKSLELENAALEKQADCLAKEIRKLSGNLAEKIV